MHRVFLGVVVASLVAGRASADTAPCRASVFELDFVKEACGRGGQPAAKQAMKTWLEQIRSIPVPPEPAPAIAARDAKKGLATTSKDEQVAKFAPLAQQQAEPEIDYRAVDCKSCHTTMAPDYRRKPEALELAKRLIGRIREQRAQPATPASSAPQQRR